MDLAENYPIGARETQVAETPRLRLMAVHAHPDDESSKGAATMARYVAEGVEVLVVTCTGGERGDILNPAMDRPEIKENIAAVRQEEMARAREILGIEQHWLGFVDSGFPEGDPPPPLPADSFAVVPLAEATEPLVREIRAFKPHVILTYDERGGYPHPDHVKCHEISVEAFEAAGDPDRYPEAGEPWQPLKLYYHMTFNKERIVALHEAMKQNGGESPYEDWIKRLDETPQQWDVTTSVPCADYFDKRDQALIAHATQIDPNGFWFAVPTETQKQAWPTEDYHLARSLVDTELPEDDLFAGVHEKVCL